MKNCFSLLLLTITVFANAQTKVYLKNRDTDAPIAYANVWNGNQLVTTSDSLGIFYLRDERHDIQYKISAIGYETLDTIKIPETATILMANTVVALDNVRLVQRKNENKTKLGKLKNGDVGIVCSMEDLVPIIAKYFPNETKEVLFLESLKFKAKCSAKNRIASISLYSVGEDGQPNEPINKQNIICRFRKGHQTIEIELKEQNIALPPNGIFVVINYLQLEQNRQYAQNNSGWFFYEPSLDATANDGEPDWWSFRKDGWKKHRQYSLSMQLILTD